MWKWPVQGTSKAYCYGLIQVRKLWDKPLNVYRLLAQMGEDERGARNLRHYLARSLKTSDRMAPVPGFLHLGTKLVVVKTTCRMSQVPS